MKRKKISIIGAGNMGTTFAKVLAENGHTIKLWDINPKVVQQINRERENKIYLPKIKLSKTISASSDIAEVVRFSNILILTIPSQFLRKTLRLIPKNDLNYEIIVSCSKGIEIPSYKFMSRVVKEELGLNSHGVVVDLSGPSIAKELCQKKLTAVVIASKNKTVLNYLKEVFENDYFKIHTSNDIIGVELGGVMKNIYSIAVGMADVMGGSMNTKAYLLTLALKEMAALGKKLGAKEKTFYELSGIGDLIATCLSPDSRNHQLGILLAKGKTVEQAQKSIKQVTEGYYAAKAIHTLVRKHSLKLPLAENVYGILYKGKKAEGLLKI